MEYFTYSKIEASKSMEWSGRAIFSYPASENPVSDIQFDDGSRVIYLGKDIVDWDFKSKVISPDIDVRYQDKYFIYDPKKYDITLVPDEEAEEYAKDFTSWQSTLGFTIITRKLKEP